MKYEQEDVDCPSQSNTVTGRVCLQQYVRFNLSYRRSKVNGREGDNIEFAQRADIGRCF